MAHFVRGIDCVKKKKKVIFHVLRFGAVNVLAAGDIRWDGSGVGETVDRVISGHDTFSRGVVAYNRTKIHRFGY